MTEVTKMRNIGPKSAAWLRQVGIRTPDDLFALGALDAFIKVRRAGFKPSMNLLYALEGAITDCHWQSITDERRSELVLAASAELDLMAGKIPGGKESPVTTLHGDDAQSAADEMDSGMSFYEFEDRDYDGGDSGKKD